MSIVLTSVFFASLLGSLHCGFMCGPYASLSSSFARFHLNRLMGYLFVGGVLFLIKDSILSIAYIKSFEKYFALAIALFLLYQGLNLVITGRGLSLHFLQKYKNAGALLAFIPCGWLWMFFLISANESSFIKSFLVLFTFWLGSMPIFFMAQVLKKRVKDTVFLSRRSAGVILILISLWQYQFKYIETGHELFHNNFSMALIKGILPTNNSSLQNICGPSSN